MMAYGLGGIIALLQTSLYSFNHPLLQLLCKSNRKNSLLTITLNVIVSSEFLLFDPLINLYVTLKVEFYRMSSFNGSFIESRISVWNVDFL